MSGYREVKLDFACRGIPVLQLRICSIRAYNIPQINAVDPGGIVRVEKRNMLSPDHEQSLRRRADRKQGARLYMMLERYLGAARLVSVGITIVPFVPEAFAPPG